MCLPHSKLQSELPVKMLMICPTLRFQNKCMCKENNKTRQRKKSEIFKNTNQTQEDIIKNPSNDTKLRSQLMLHLYDHSKLSVEKWDLPLYTTTHIMDHAFQFNNSFLKAAECLLSMGHSWTDLRNCLKQLKYQDNGITEPCSQQGQ